MPPENSVMPIDSNQAQCTQESGRADSEMVLVNKCGLTGQSTSASGETTELMEKESSFMLMEIFMKDSGLTIRLMVQELISMLTAPCMRVNGKMTFNTAKVSKLGLTNQDMKVTTHSVVNTESALINGTTSRGTREIGVKTKSAG
jgi:hypothetical protein